MEYVEHGDLSECIRDGRGKARANAKEITKQYTLCYCTWRKSRLWCRLIAHTPITKNG